MRITVESTKKIITLETPTGTVQARVWEGHTESGIAVHCFVTRIAVHRKDDTAQFEAELQETSAPSPTVQAIPLRMIL